ncbi:MAG: PIG-L family deacetylase [Rikenellaceae bacterium]|nr:PIG-L family deacetylase [Rikenellaceae bacterium]
MNRREMLKASGTLLAGMTLFGPQALAAATTENPTDRKSSKSASKRKALVIGAHPDDPENVGGTMLLLREAGWDVAAVYMTRGEGGIKGKTGDEAAAIRTEEAIEACKILDVRPIFMTQIDGNTEINKERYAEMREVIAAEQPDLVITHWPIDGHPDHRVCSLLVYDAWRRLGYNFELYYFETMTGTQTQYFQPTDYVDISRVAERKHKAYFAHVSQNTTKSFARYHDRVERFRGLEFRCERAEAFVHLRRDTSDIEF